ncbi:hypothetical protein [Cryptosporangium sp. NPDC051539]|uniref:hypothetical protein n=1 Tax=Cryptosporangium sp. NPDC051539 TaxID=3363962 RepID=UPI00378AFE87
MTAHPHPVAPPQDDEPSLDELARRQGVKRVTSLSELAHPELWESDEDYEQFLADLYASRRGAASA